MAEINEDNGRPHGWKRIAALAGTALLIPLGAGLRCRTNRDGPE